MVITFCIENEKTDEDREFKWTMDRILTTYQISNEIQEFIGYNVQLNKKDSFWNAPFCCYRYRYKVD